MNSVLDYLGTLALQYPDWTNFIIFFGMVIQGEITALLSLYLVVGNHISLLQFTISAIAGLFASGIFFYTFGKMLRGTRFGWRWYRKMKDNRKIQLYTYYLKHHTARILILGKFIPGMNAPILILMGWTKTAFSKFIRVYAPAVFFWFIVATTSAYAVTSGLHYLRENKIFKDIEYLVIGIIILLFFGEYLLKKILDYFSPKEFPELESALPNYVNPDSESRRVNQGEKK